MALRSSLRTPVAAALLAASAGASPAASQAAALPPVDLAARGTMEVDRIGVGAAADGSAVTMNQRGGYAYAAIKQPGQLFPTATKIDDAEANKPTLAVARTGRAVLAWHTGSGASAVLRVAVRDPGASSFRKLTPVPTAGIEHIAPAVADDGRIFIGWASTSQATLLTAEPDATALTAATTISATSLAALAVGTQTGGSIGWMLVTSRSPGASSATARRWSPAIGASGALNLETKADAGGATYYAEAPSIISGDHPTFLWERNAYFGGILGGGTTELVQVTEPVPATPVPQVLDTATFISTITSASRTIPTAAIDAAGTGLVGYALEEGTLGAPTNSITVRGRAASGALAPPTVLPGLTSIVPAGEGIDAFSLVPTGEGAARAFYAFNTSLFTVPLSAQGAATQVEPTVLPLSTSTERVRHLAAAGTGSGESAAVWSSGTFPQYEAKLWLDDPTPPTLKFAPRPAIVTYGLTRTFSAIAADRWTPVTVTWDFGDGATATGSDVTHTYATRGNYKVTATATDAAGNVTSQSFNESVELAPPLPTAPAGEQAKLSQLRLSRTSFKVQTKKPSPARGSVLTFELSAAAKVELTVTHKATGYRTASGKSCTPRKPKAVKRPKRCTYDKLAGLVAAPSLGAGQQSIALTGKLANGKSLKPGKYTLLVASVAPLQSHGTNPRKIGFTIRK